MKATLPLLAVSALSLGFQPSRDPPPETPTVQVFQADTLLAEHAESGESYTQFLRVPALHAGIYTLPAEGRDGQSPHAEDEVYYVLAGKATLRAGGKDHPVRAGSLIYVKAKEEHRFVDITEDLEILVLFSTGPTDPPEKDFDR